MTLGRPKINRCISSWVFEKKGRGLFQKTRKNALLKKGHFWVFFGVFKKVEKTLKMGFFGKTMKNGLFWALFEAFF